MTKSPPEKHGKCKPIEVLFDLLFPPKCPFCERLLEHGVPLCPICQQELPWLKEEAAEKLLEDAWWCVAPLRYDDKVQHAVHAYKFQGKSCRSGALGSLIAQCVQEHGLSATLISWPPLSKKRLKARGYDQAQLLAEEVGRHLSLPVVRTLQKRDVPAQSSLHSDRDRHANIHSAYQVWMPERFVGKDILLIDDVVTSGATLSACAKVLEEAGAGRIACAALSRAR